MTNKSLSQQLCEACGIEPEIIEDYDSNEYEFYPDFENNSNNKIKLLEIISKYSPNLVFLQNVFPIENTIKYCLSTLNDTRYTYYSRKKLNQAIKNEQWEV